MTTSLSIFLFFLFHQSYSYDINFTSINGELKINGQTLYIKGANWFGMETIEKSVQGLWPHATNMKQAITFLKENKFNALRLPLAMDSIINNPEVDNTQISGQSNLIGKKYLEVLDILIEECSKQNILVLLDNHRLEASQPDFPDLWYNGNTPTLKNLYSAFDILTKRYCNQSWAWNILGIDLKNEPKGIATWGSGKKNTDWNEAATNLGNHILKSCDRWLIFVEGIQTYQDNGETYIGQPGGNFVGVKKNPIELTKPNQLVYSPHVLCFEDDTESNIWHASNFPNNLPLLWDTNFGFLPKETKKGIVVGNWGSNFKDKNKEYSDELLAYLIKHQIGSFYWALNPQSGNKGGLLLDDWKSPNPTKLKFLSNLPSTNIDNVVKELKKCIDNQCKGNGKCVDGYCQCNPGWNGPQCEICSKDSTDACQEVGTCQADHTCKCEEGYKGKYCEIDTCDSISCGSSNAKCDQGKCVCKFECIGSQCQKCTSLNNQEFDCSKCPKGSSNPASLIHISFSASVCVWIYWMIYYRL